VREMSISENYEGEITSIRSNISRFSRGTVIRTVSIDEIMNDVTLIRSDISRFSRGTIGEIRVQQQRELFVSQGHHGVDSHRAPCWYVTGEQ
jgi:hypothetical protein